MSDRVVVEIPALIEEDDCPDTWNYVAAVLDIEFGISAEDVPEMGFIELERDQAHVLLEFLENINVKAYIMELDGSRVIA